MGTKFHVSGHLFQVIIDVDEGRRLQVGIGGRFIIAEWYGERSS